MSEFVPIYAVDFDGTLCESQWPGIGAPNTKLIEHLIKRRSQGAKIILWTCRVDERLQEAVDWCKEHGLEFDAVNDNLPEMIEKYGNNTRKIHATCYIDDLAVDKEKYGIPFHEAQENDRETLDKYAIGSKWILIFDEIKIPVQIVAKNYTFGEIEARSMSSIDKFKNYSVRREAEWFNGKLFPMEGEKNGQRKDDIQ